MDGQADIRPGDDKEGDRSAAMRLRAERPRVTRLSRKVLAGGAAVVIGCHLQRDILGITEQPVPHDQRRQNSTRQIITMLPTVWPASRETMRVSPARRRR